MKRLREQNLLKKEDIREHDLLNYVLLSQNAIIFPEDRFLFLADWDPDSLMSLSRPDMNEQSWLPIHISSDRKDIRAFKVTFEAGMKHFPEKLGFVFKKLRDTHGRTISTTPYESACLHHGREDVTNEILDHISECPATSTGSLLLSLAADKAIDLDGLFLFLRHEPAVLRRVLQTGHNNNNDSDNGSDINVIVEGIVSGTSVTVTATTDTPTPCENRTRKRDKKKDEVDDRSITSSRGTRRSKRIKNRKRK